MGKPKLIQLGKYYHPVPGGMETHLYDQCCYFRDRFEIDVLVANTGAQTVQEQIDGVRVTRMANYGELFSNPICPSFPYHLRQMNGAAETLVQLHLPNPTAHFAYLLANPEGRLIVVWHSDIVRQKVLSKFYRKHLLQLLQRADCIVATSPNYVQHSEYLSKFADKCVVVPLGIRPEKFETTPEIQARATRIRTRFGPRMVLFVGRLTYYKGLNNLLQAAEHIRGTVVLVGDGPLRKSLEKIIEERNLDNCVFIEPRVDDTELAAYYHACDVFVLPSNQRSEAFGIVQLEAMACGKPVVSTNLKTGVPWVNRHEETGLVVPVDDILKLSEAVNELLDNHVQRRQMGSAARRHVLENFTVEKVSIEMERVYDTVLNGGIVPENELQF